MIIINNITGLDNEFEFVKLFNGKTIKEVDPISQELLYSLFKNIPDNEIIKAWRNHYKQKSDIFIQISGVMKGISIKKGMKNSVHVERISDFIAFLKDNDVNEDMICEYLKYHYADGTINGTGKNRMTAEEYKKEHQNEIDELNEKLNRIEIVKKAIDRFILKGNNSKFSIDALICGEVNDYIWIIKDDILKIIMQKIKDYSSAVHFGSLTCQPKNRCLNYNPKYEKDRYSIQIKWYNLFDDIIENMYLSNLEKKELQS